MKLKNKYIFICALSAALGFSSCDDYLDKLPDNRMELRDAQDITDLLVAAYPQHYPAYLTEKYSDNTDRFNVTGWNNGEQFDREAYNWQDITDISSDESPYELWEAFYTAVSTANQALQAISQSPDSASLSAQKGEALICRAYSEFLLANTFCEAYSPATASTKLGIPYPKVPETVVGEKYERGTLQSVYENINADIEAALPLISDQYTQPKFHFTRSAAYAFAAQFNLYYGNYDKAISYADRVLGASGATGLRDWAAFYALSPNRQVAPNGYVNSSNNANIMLLTYYSQWGAAYGPYSVCQEFAHGRLIDQTETLEADGPWGSTANFGYTVWYNGDLSKYFINKIPYSFEITDQQAQIGYAHSELPVFNTDMLLLVRAEAKALKGDLAGAVRDLNLEVRAMSVNGESVTLDGINSFYSSIADYTPTAPTPKKPLHPVFTSLTDSTQTNVLQAILQLRRVLTLGEGQRWQDVKRYGIVIYRRTLNRGNQITAITDSLTVNDPRRAIQLPQDVIEAGMQPNPRN